MVSPDVIQTIANASFDFAQAAKGTVEGTMERCSPIFANAADHTVGQDLTSSAEPVNAPDLTCG